MSHGFIEHIHIWLIYIIFLQSMILQLTTVHKYIQLLFNWWANVSRSQGKDKNNNENLRWRRNISWPHGGEIWFSCHHHHQTHRLQSCGWRENSGQHTNSSVWAGSGPVLIRLTCRLIQSPHQEILLEKEHRPDQFNDLQLHFLPYKVDNSVSHSPGWHRVWQAGHTWQKPHICKQEANKMMEWSVARYFHKNFMEWS